MSKIVKVTLEYEDRAESISGLEAERWLDKVNGMCVFMQNRGMNPFEPYDFEWTPEDKTV